MSFDQTQEESKEFQPSFTSKVLSLAETKILIILTQTLKFQNF